MTTLTRDDVLTVATAITTSTDTLTDTDTLPGQVAREVEPLRRLLHSVADTYGRHTDERRALILAAADITTALTALRDAIEHAVNALVVTPENHTG